MQFMKKSGYMMRASVLLQLLSFWLSTRHGIVTALPKGFIDEGVTRLSGAISGTFAKDASGTTLFFLATKEGVVHLVNNPFGVGVTTSPVLTLKPCKTADRGLQSIVAHPTFAQNGWLYVFYATLSGCVPGPTSGPSNVISRFQWVGGKFIEEKVILKGPSNAEENHSGGAMMFGPDGYLYATFGDGGAPRDPPISQFTWTLHGKMIRINEHGSAPPSNPFAATGVSCRERGGDAVLKRNCSEIIALGLRSPFRAAMDPNTDQARFFVNDVGGARWEDIHEGRGGQALANYGWPTKEGPCDNGSYASGCSPEAKFNDPIHWYAHLNSTGGNTGKAIVGGAFVPNNVWPSHFDNTYLFGDFVAGKIIKLKKDSSVACRTCKPPRSTYKETVFHSHQRIVDIFFGPYKQTQALYYTTRVGDVNVRRIRFTGDSNRLPVAVISATSTLMGKAPLTVSFTASNSKDPDPNDSLSYSWTWGDGSAGSSGLMVSHQYTKNGTYSVRLTVTDKAGLADQAVVTVVVGTQPTVTMKSPKEGSTFAVGESFWLNATAKDSSGLSIPSSAMVWEVRRHHNTHFHSWMDATTGNGLKSKAAPPPEDYIAATNSYIEIVLTVRDSQGLKTKISRNLLPRKVPVDFDTEPSNLELLLIDGTVVKTPVRIISWENHVLKVHMLASNKYAFDSWSDGKNKSHGIRVQKQETKVQKYVMRLKTK